jgi:hypothetical protein
MGISKSEVSCLLSYLALEFELVSRPANYKELYNLRHSQARNVIERIFGVAKLRWRVLAQGSRFSIRIQAAVVYAVAVLHNFCAIFDPDTPDDLPPASQAEPDGQTMSTPSSITRAESIRASAKRDEIAQAMWVSYQSELERRGVIRS